MAIPVPPEGTTTGERFERFVAIIAALRGEGGCPWDREQTHLSISRNMVEEAAEAVAALEEGDPDEMAEELGDVLLEVVLQAQIGLDDGEFTIDDVIDSITAKMIRRHPHVFGDEASIAALGLSEEEAAHVNAVRTPGDVNFLWDFVKKHEKEQKRRARAARLGVDADELPEGVLDGVSKAAPALMQAQDISRKAVKKGFEWDTREDVWEKFREEAGEYEEAVASAAAGKGALADAELEFGDVLFTLVNVARKDGIDAETALRRSCDKFRTRWSAMERRAAAEGRPIDSYGIEGLDALWNAAKAELG